LNILALLIPIFSIGLSPQRTILDLRLKVPDSLPKTLEAGDFLLFKFGDPKNIFLDGKRGSALPNGQVFLAPSPESYGHSATLYYRRYQNDSLTWWSKNIPVLESLKSIDAIRLPASIAVTSTEDYNHKLQEKVRPLKSDLLSGCFAKPLSSRITSVFGEPRILPNGNFYRHNGIDQRAWTGAPVQAISDGIVTFADELDVTGNIIVVDHGAGLSSRYMHLSKFKIKSGQNVSKGDVIGFSGNSGRSSAPHLHWEVSWKGYPLDPVRFLRKLEPICDPT
jgi:murein DD-endopeptidase MepM/ murein hydrolase activator NlpD